MAQAVFDEHPLEEYLRDSGEAHEMMPGSTFELEQEIDFARHLYLETDEEEDVEWRPHYLLQILELVQSTLSSTTSNAPSPFVERFKYNIISSTLLAPSLPALHSARGLRSPSIPGKLDHSRSSSLETPDSVVLPNVAPPESHYGVISLVVVLVPALFSAGCSFLGLLSIFFLSLLVYNNAFMIDTPKTDMTPSLEALDELVAANKAWESVVQDALDTVENEERSNLYGSLSPSNPSSPIRVALHSTLQTTQTQCDNVRNIFSALTSPSELSQLSEMYAPPSPLKSNFSLLDLGSRPLSLPSRRRTSSVPNLNGMAENKRATWNGSYSHLARAGSPTSQVFKRREKHRSNLSALLQVDTPPSKSASAPVTPVPPSPSKPLTEVHEDGEAEESIADSFSTDVVDHFGAAALDLRRKRRTGGVEAFRTPPPSYFSSMGPSPKSPRDGLITPTISSSSRFTSMQAMRHPLSPAALRHTMQGALASKRYACSHLLALRFSEEEDEGYWEDVRSVMSLLTTTFVDASSRLTEALDELEHQKLADQHPTPGIESEGLFPAFSEQSRQQQEAQVEGSRRRSNRISFAPVASHMSRFGAHVAAISSALDEAREHLEECVNALKDEPSSSSTPPRTAPRGSDDGVEESAALQAYERLRRELGLTLRECERGRTHLLDVLHPPRPMDEEDEEDDVPALGHDASDESDNKPDPEDVVEQEPSPSATGPTVVSVNGGEGALDDASSHLLLGASAHHLPPPGIEQVFEADSGSSPLFARERSKLSREERIKLAKARRESSQASYDIGAVDAVPGNEKRGIEKWGPGGEVVQELKDVIWKVGERRRKMLDGQLQSS